MKKLSLQETQILSVALNWTLEKNGGGELNLEDFLVVTVFKLLWPYQIAFVLSETFQLIRNFSEKVSRFFASIWFAICIKKISLQETQILSVAFELDS